MTIETFMTYTSLFSGIASLVLAIFTIGYTRISEREMRQQHERAQQRLNEQFERTKEVLADIEKKATLIEKTVSDSQDKMLSTMTHIINETVIPKKVDVGEQIGMMFLQQILQNPDQGEKMMKALMPVIEFGNRSKT